MVAPTITNPDFETEDPGVPGGALGWSLSATTSVFEVAGFDGDTLGFEAYESGWGALSLEFLEADLEAAEFENEEVEDYERVWGPFDGTDSNYATKVLAAANLGDNSGFIFEFSLLAAAQFDSAIVGQNFEDYEEGWSANENYVFAFVGIGTDLEAAVFDVAVPQNFEDYEEEWSPSPPLFDFVGIGTDLEAALFGVSTPDTFEDYESEGSPIDGDEVLNVLTGVIDTYIVTINGVEISFPSTMAGDVGHVRDGMRAAINASTAIDVLATDRIGAQIVLKNLSTQFTPMTLGITNPASGEIERLTPLFLEDRWLQPLLGF